MRIVAQFDPSAAASGTFNAAFANNSGRIVVYNESNINLQLQWGSFTTYCPAWVAMLYCVQTANVNINWSQLSVLPVPAGSSSPISLVLVETYESFESIPGVFPAALVRQVNIGNSTPLSTSTNSIVNDGNVANTKIIEATVAGDSSSAVTLTNDGHLTLGDLTHTGSFSSDNGHVFSDGLGTLKVQQLKFFTAGSFTAVSQFGPYTVTTVTSTVNHNLGTTPDLVLLQITGTGGGAAFAAYYKDNTMTSTTVDLTTNSVGGVPVRGLAIKF